MYQYTDKEADLERPFTRANLKYGLTLVRNKVLFLPGPNLMASNKVGGKCIWLS